METTVIIVLGIVSLSLGGALVFMVLRSANRGIDTDNVVQTLTTQFGQLSFEALSKQKKGLIDQQLVAMKRELGKVSNLVSDLEKDRQKKFGELASQLKLVGEQTASLTSTAGSLREALVNSRVRGQWGERMAEDVLRLIGFVEGVNYQKQRTIEANGSRPDFTFLLPRDLKLNMDVKFPLDNYLKFVETDTPQDKDQYLTAFLRDVRGRLKEVATRDYIDSRQNTLDCVLLFITRR